MSFDTPVPCEQTGAPLASIIGTPMREPGWPFDGASELNAVNLLPETWLAVLRTSFEDITTFAHALHPREMRAQTLDRMAGEILEHVDAGRAGNADECAFDVELPGLGRVVGRASLRRGHIDLELHALRPESAAMLRGRLSQLQRRLDREADCEVHLFIT